MSSIATCYRRMTGAFGEKAPYYTRPQGHSGADYAGAVGEAVVTYETITITTVEWSQYIGWCVEGRTRDGKYIGWAHLRNVTVRVGNVVTAGKQFAEVAGPYDRPGSTWFGAHKHTTLGDHSGAIFYGMTYDPVPRINAAIKASSVIAGGGGTPTNPQEDDDMSKNSGFYYTRSKDKAIVCMIANTESGFCSEYTQGEPGKMMPNGYNNAVANAFGTGAFAPITEGHAKAIKTSLNIVDDDPVVLDINDADIKALVEAMREA